MSRVKYIVTLFYLVKTKDYDTEIVKGSKDVSMVFVFVNLSMLEGLRD